MAADQLGDHGQLAARDLHARVLGAGLEAHADRLQQRRVGLLDGHVVQHGDRVGAHADHVVHVHGDAVDADRVVAAHLLGHDELGAHAVGGQRQPGVAGQPQHVGVVARAQQRPALAAGVDRLEHPHQRGHAGAGLAGVHARACVCGVAHAAELITALPYGQGCGVVHQDPGPGRAPPRARPGPAPRPTRRCRAGRPGPRAGGSRRASRRGGGPRSGRRCRRRAGRRAPASGSAPRTGRQGRCPAAGPRACTGAVGPSARMSSGGRWPALA